MNFHTNFRATPDFQKQAAREIFFKVFLKGRWTGVVGFTVAGIICLMMPDLVPWVFPVVFLVLALSLLVVWLRGYRSLQKQAEDFVGSLQNPVIEVDLDDENLRVVMDGGVREVAWEEMDELLISRSCVIPIVEKQPVVCLPLAIFPDAILQEIRRQ